MRTTFLLLVVTLVGVGHVQEPQASCGSPSGSGADSDLYCIELLPAGQIAGASGVARLIPPSSPFGIAVSPAGEQLYDVEFTLASLPDDCHFLI